MTREVKLAYSRGYNAGVAGRWPLHRPPTPPDHIIAQLVKALSDLRDAADGEILATIMPDDEFYVILESPVDAAGEALETLGKWVRSDD